MKLLVFLGGSLLLEGIGIVSACPTIWNDFNTYVFEVDQLIVITSLPFSLYHVLAFASMRSPTNIAYSFDLLSAFCYFTRLFLLTTW